MTPLAITVRTFGGRGHERGRDLAAHAAGAAPRGVADVEGGELRRLGDPAHELGGAVPARVPGVQPVLVGEQHQGVRAQHDRHLRREHVVVAEADLVGGRGVVLVDHRHDAPRQQPAQRVARVDVAVAALEVLAGEQHLGGGELVVAEQPLVVGEQAALADRGGRLQRRHLARPLGRRRARAARRRWRRWRRAPRGGPRARARRCRRRDRRAGGGAGAGGRRRPCWSRP